MPIEIRELEISATIQDSSVATQNAQAIESINRESIIAECVEAVLEVLKQKNER